MRFHCSKILRLLIRIHRSFAVLKRSFDTFFCELLTVLNVISKHYNAFDKLILSLSPHQHGGHLTGCISYQKYQSSNIDYSRFTGNWKISHSLHKLLLYLSLKIPQPDNCLLLYNFLIKKWFLKNNVAGKKTSVIYYCRV